VTLTDRPLTAAWRRSRWHGSTIPLEQAECSARQRACKAVYTGSIPMGAFFIHSVDTAAHK